VEIAFHFHPWVLGRLRGGAIWMNAWSVLRSVSRRTAFFTRSNNMDLIRILIAILLPPLGVFLQVGFAGAFWLNILLTLLGYIPGIVHAVYIIAKR
jgi:uncharacterized membrane protein YqaE (UPF0057 family)